MIPVFYLNQLNMDSNKFYESIFIGKSLEYMNHICKIWNLLRGEGIYREYRKAAMRAGRQCGLQIRELISGGR